MLQVEHLTLKFGGLVANNDVSMTVEQGKITGLIGPNGAGKTTFFNSISGVYRPTSGTVTFLGKRIDGLQPYQINQLGMSRTYQVINLFRKMSVVENVMVGMHPHMKQGFFASAFKTRAERREERECCERAYELLDFVNLKDRAFEEAGSLSYGQQRHLEIVRGLASDPKLILLDEPAAGLNPSERKEFIEIIQKVFETGVDMFLIEHNMDVVMNLSHDITVLNFGCKIAEGNPKEILENEEVISAYLGEGYRRKMAKGAEGNA